MRALPVGVWDDVRNVRSAIFFVLSGGDPAVLKLVIGRERTPHIERRLLKGALAYGEGRLIDALALMQKMEARKLDPSLAGMVALIQGTLTAKKDGQNALVYFRRGSARERLSKIGTAPADHDFGAGWRSRKVRRPCFAVFQTLSALAVCAQFPPAVLCRRGAAKLQARFRMDLTKPN